MPNDGHQITHPNVVMAVPRDTDKQAPEAAHAAAAREEPVVLLDEPLALEDADVKASVAADDGESTDKLSITDLVNLDNISAHSLYLGPELKRLGSSNIAYDSDAYSGSLLGLNTDDDDDEDECGTLGSSKGTSAPSSGSASPKPEVEIDYSALDRFGFIVLGDEDSVGGRGSEEEQRIRRKQYRHVK
jgi:hypothetical protein